MQLKLRRSQRVGGVISNVVIFCLDARVEFTKQERDNLVRYKLDNQVIYNSEASKRALEKADASAGAHGMGDWQYTGSQLKALAFTALAAMRLNISVRSLQQGQHIECKSMDELLGAEEAIMTACQNLRGYLDTAASFDGREVLIDFATDKQPTIVAETTPQPALILEPPAAAPLAALPSSTPDGLPPPAPKPLIVDERSGYAEPSPVQYEMMDGEAVPTRRGYDAAQGARKRSSNGDGDFVIVIMSVVAGITAIVLVSFLFKMQGG